MNNKSIIAAGAALTAVIAVVGMSISTYASEGGDTNKRGFMKNENREAIHESLDNDDYEAWRELVGTRAEEITADNFSSLVEAHELMQSGDREGAKAIFDELGLERPGKGMKRGLNPEVKTAIENNDYYAFVEAVGDKPIAEKITADNFVRFVEAHELMQSGDKEGAKAIFDELGLERQKKGMKHGPRFDKNGDGVCDRMDLDQE